MPHAVLGPGQVFNGITPGPAQVPHRLFGRGGQPDGHELAGTQLAGQAPGVALVGLCPVTGGDRDQRWGDHLAGRPETSSRCSSYPPGPAS